MWNMQGIEHRNKTNYRPPSATPREKRTVHFKSRSRRQSDGPVSNTPEHFLPPPDDPKPVGAISPTRAYTSGAATNRRRRTPQAPKDRQATDSCLPTEAGQRPPRICVLYLRRAAAASAWDNISPQVGYKASAHLHALSSPLLSASPKTLPTLVALTTLAPVDMQLNALTLILATLACTGVAAPADMPLALRVAADSRSARYRDTVAPFDLPWHSPQKI
ncbi:hypothetical protein SCP_0802220 [Sparassis crispa]|uniref:Uncharacterized protein n=1 Tax=Sparassis crispa TaxID=139825 RepID=A0A401GU34_9APHY|nr:hypothetical protein SCP_0802220 [Sparassis crispa]GBE85700.1 hypothetical protein SCP_0802220 [Sparassis crispa]